MIVKPSHNIPKILGGMCPLCPPCSYTYVTSQYSSILSLSYSSSSFNMTESSDPASCVESDLEKGSENIVVPFQYEPEESGSESESSYDESQNDKRLLNTEWLVSCVC